jgi:hypothetical protein
MTGAAMNGVRTKSANNNRIEYSSWCLWICGLPPDRQKSIILQEHCTRRHEVRAEGKRQYARRHRRAFGETAFGQASFRHDLVELANPAPGLEILWTDLEYFFPDFNEMNSQYTLARTLH